MKVNLTIVAFIIFIVTGLSLFNIIPNNPIVIDTNNNREIQPQTNSGDFIKSINKNIHFDEYSSKLGPLPQSLKGTIIPIHFQVDSENNLVITKSIKSLIEYFLSANTEENSSTIKNRIYEIIDQQLNPPAQKQAKDLIDQYFQYKQGLLSDFHQLEEDTNFLGSNQNPIEMIKLREKLRRESFSQEIYEAFFSEQDQLDTYKLVTLEINNSNVSQEEKNVQLAEAELQLSESLRNKKHKERFKKQEKQAIELAKDNGASEDELFLMREQAYDHETAIRFAEADKKQKAWQNRYDQYQQLRLDIENTDGFNEEDKQLQIDQLRNEHFSGQEKLRVRTLDRMSQN